MPTKRQLYELAKTHRDTHHIQSAKALSQMNKKQLMDYLALTPTTTNVVDQDKLNEIKIERMNRARLAKSSHKPAVVAPPLILSSEDDEPAPLTHQQLFTQHKNIWSKLRQDEPLESHIVAVKLDFKDKDTKTVATILKKLRRKLQKPVPEPEPEPVPEVVHEPEPVPEPENILNEDRGAPLTRIVSFGDQPVVAARDPEPEPEPPSVPAPIIDERPMLRHIRKVNERTLRKATAYSALHKSRRKRIAKR